MRYPNKYVLLVFFLNTRTCTRIYMYCVIFGNVTLFNYFNNTHAHVYIKKPTIILHFFISYMIVKFQYNHKLITTSSIKCLVFFCQLYIKLFLYIWLGLNYIWCNFSNTTPLNNFIVSLHLYFEKSTLRLHFLNLLCLQNF